MIRRLSAGLLCLAALLTEAPALAQDGTPPVPERRAIAVPDTDFYGGDIRSIMDTELALCERACLTDAACTAFTFNTRARACFLKNRVERLEPYTGALSAILVETPAATLDRAAARAADLSFLPADMLAAAHDLALRIGHETPRPIASAAAILTPPEEVTRGTNDEATLDRLAARVARSDAAADWLDHARAALSIPGDSAVKRKMRDLAAASLVNAWLRADGGYVAASAMERLARVLEAMGRGRLAIPALRLALATDPDPETEAAMDRVIGLFGFHVTGHRVESDLAEPRICLDFSEDLAEAGVDYAAFLRLDGPDLPVEVEGGTLCVSGVKHGQTYRLALRAGLPARSGETLVKPSDLEVYVRDRSPSVRFTGRAYVLPKSADAAIPVVTVNTAAIDLAIHRMGARSLLPGLREGLIGGTLNSWQEGRIAGQLGEAVWTGSADVARRVNEDVTTALPIGQALAAFQPGIYVMTARVPGRGEPWEDAATQWFVVTDLGLATVKGTDGLTVIARGLSDAAARAGITVTLIAANNEVLGTAVTDADGVARFAPGLTRGIGGMEPALVTAEDADGDFVFLSLADAAFDLSDRGVEGRMAPPPVDLFLATERGVYRPGETVHATLLARDGSAKAVPDLTLTAIVTRPDGVEHARLTLPDSGAGGRVAAIALPPSAQRGTWRLRVHADPKAAALADLPFLVEDFVPERIEVDLTLPEGPIDPAALPVAGVAARYLYGAPGADLSIEGEVVVAGTRSLPGFPGYVFGRAEEEVYPRVETIAPARTDAEGRAEVAFALPDLPAVSRPLSAALVLRVAEGSGRPVERRLDRPLAPARPLLGIRPLFEEVVPQDSPARFEVVAAGTDLKPAALPRVGWTLNRIETTWQWYQSDGSWRWEAITRRTRVATGEVALTADGPARIEAPVGWGQHELKLVSLTDGAVAASQTFWAGWYAPQAGSDTPDRLTVALDRPAYAPGDTARLRVEAREAGTLLVQVLTDRLVSMQALTVAAGETVVDLAVTEAWGPGAYVAATLIRPLDRPAGRNPERAIGIAWAGIDPGPAVLAASFQTPDEVSPRGPLDVALRIDGLAPGARAFATIAAVDVGILNLTGHKAPDPVAHYFGQRRLGVELRDLYGRLIDGLQGDPTRLRSGGDGDLNRLRAAPKTEEAVSFFSGPVAVGPDGLVRVRFDLPDFNGTVKLMAVAWTADAVGRAEKDVLVRDPVVITTAVPRFLAPGDRALMRLDLAHVTGPAGEVEVTVTADPGLKLPDGLSGRIAIAPRGRAELEIPVEALAVGDPAITVSVVTPEGRRLVRTQPLSVRVYDPEVARSSRIPLAARDGRLVVDAAAFDGLVPGTGRATLALGPFARFDVPGLMAALDRYPHGCTEQVTSRALPLLYLSAVAEAMGMGEREPLGDRIAGAIEAVLANQASNGSFGLWRPDSGDLWLDAYVTDFLSRARALGHPVPDAAFRLAVQNLRNQVAYAQDFESGGEGLAYALMVMARENVAAVGDLRYYADIKAGAFATPLALAQLGLALAYYGDQPRADALFRRAGDKVAPEEAPVWRVDYGSRERDAAAILALAAEARSAAVDRSALTRIALPSSARLGLRSTQDNAWTLLAAHALIEQAPGLGLHVDGVPMTGPLVRLVEPGDGRVVIENRGDVPIDAALTVFGVPDQPEPAGGDGYRIERAYFSLTGEPADLQALARSDRLVVVLTVTPERDGSARLIVNDPLPAGLEIENPSLLRSGDISALDWLDLPDVARHAEFRAERFVAAVDWSGTAPFRLAYVVRAVSAGTFHHPAAIVEDMYRPVFRARTDTGRVVVVP